MKVICLQDQMKVRIKSRIFVRIACILISSVPFPRLMMIVFVYFKLYASATDFISMNRRTEFQIIYNKSSIQSCFEESS